MVETPLDRMHERTRELTALHLRSAAVVMASLHGLVLEAHRFGYSHSAIHACLQAAGLRITRSTYKSCLRRLKRQALAAAPEPAHGEARFPETATRRDAISGAGDPLGAVGPRALHVCTDLPSATRALDALHVAKRLGGRDYAQAARDLHRKAQS